MPDKNYIPWANAGGPNECVHGYAEGIPCPQCDADEPQNDIQAAAGGMTQVAIER